MKKPGSEQKYAGISDAAVTARTGKSWQEWFALLDKAGAEKLDHPAIVRCLAGHRGINGWWKQMVTVGYEHARGLRVRHETPRGFSVSRSRTVPVPVARAFAAWSDPAARKRWLGSHDLTVRKATPNKSIRITWGSGPTSVEVNFYAKGSQKCQVTVQHSKLPSARQAAAMKSFWSDQLDMLSSTLSPTTDGG